MNFVDAIVAFLNIGLFSSLISRFTGANTAILVFCSLLYLGCEPLETIGIMLTYLVFLRLTIYTQNQKLNFKKLKVFRGFRVFFPILLIVISLFLYPFAALAIFLFLFMTEILAKMKEEVPDDRQMTTSQLIPYIAIGSVLITVSMICVKFIPAAYYYIFGGVAGLLLCFFFWWLGQDRSVYQLRKKTQCLSGTETVFLPSGTRSLSYHSFPLVFLDLISQTGSMICAAISIRHRLPTTCRSFSCRFST